MHKSNSTYLTDLDVSRAKVLSNVFRQGFEHHRRRGETVPHPVLGGVQCDFKRPIRPYQKYEVISRILTWDEKWIWVGSWFVSMPKNGGRTVFACCISKVVWKEGRRTVPPWESFRRSGLLSTFGHAACGGSVGVDDKEAMCFEADIAMIDLKRVQGLGMARDVEFLMETIERENAGNTPQNAR